MNQATNLIQWKNLTEDQREDFDFFNGNYEFQASTRDEWEKCSKKTCDQSVDSITRDYVYRLKILPDEWYYFESGDESRVWQGADITPRGINNMQVLRPALPEEIPKPEPTLLERIEAAYEGKEVVLLEWSNSGYLLYTDEDCDQRRPHIEAQSMKGFDGFIYDWKDIDNDLPFTKIFPPVRLGCHPIAAVFNK